MWKKYLALGAAVWMLSGVSTVSHASETVSGGQEVETQELENETLQTGQTGTYMPYEGAKYSLSFTVSDNGIVITGISDYESKSDLGELVIPAEINGVTVTTIGECAFNGCSGLTGSLNIPDSVTTIGSGAFSICSGLTGNLNIPDSVTTIGECAFGGCRGLTGSLNIPKGVTTIVREAFSGCSGLTGSLSIPEGVTTIEEGAFSHCSGFTGELNLPAGVTTIGESAFEYCSGFTGSLSIPTGVTTIGSRAFYNCSGFTGDLNIPAGVTEIGERAFYMCVGLTGSLNIPEGVTIIGGSAFFCCDGLTGELNIPDSVTEIGSAAFAECRGFTGELNLPAGVTEISDNTFYCCGFTGSLNIPEGVTTIGKRAFYICSGFTGELNLPAGVTEIGSEAFCACSGFTGSLSIPEGVTTIEDGAFYGCSGFTGELNLPAGVTEIGSKAFSDCSGLTGELNLPAGVTTIGSEAFHGCSGFTGSLRIPEGVTTIGESVFFLCRGLTGELYIPAGVTEIGDSAFSGCRGLTGELKIPAGVTEIGGYAFSGCSGFTGELKIPAGVTTIENGVFSHCSGFTGELKIPAGVTEIGGYAFSGCSGFTGELKIPAGVTTIENGVFSHCSGFTGELKIPAGVTEIGSEAFTYCSGFTGELKIPAGVTRIQSKAFCGCSGFTGELKIPAGVAAIETETFRYCSGFTGSLNIPESVGVINMYAFSGCSGFTGELKIPAGVMMIGGGAFNGCSGFTGELKIPADVWTIDRFAFAGCSGIRDITVLGKGTRIPYGLDISFVHGYSDSRVARDASKWNYTFIPIDAPEITEYRVSTAQELLDAIGTAGEGSYRRIILADGVYNISDPIALSKIVFVTVEAENPGKAEILSQDASKAVITVNQCADVSIVGCVLGYDPAAEQTGTAADLVQIQNSYDVNVILYGQSITTTVSGVDMQVTVSMTVEEQKQFVSELAAQEGITVTEGVEVTVDITVSDAESTLAESDRQTINQFAAAGKYEIGQYLDIIMSLLTGGDSKPVSHTEKPVRLKVDIPKALQKAGRVFSVIRLHDGKAVLLEDLDQDPDTVTIETDCFSAYTIVYRETGDVGCSHTPGAWSSDDANHWKSCTVCGEELEKSAHAFVWAVDKAATEDETGLSHEECSCGAKRGENTVIPKLDHVHIGIQHHPATDATCTTKGNVEYWTCAGARCQGKYYQDSACQIEIKVVETAIDPDHHVYDGNADSDCNLCGYKRFYLIISGANAIYMAGSENDLTFTADGDYKLFQAVEMDGNVLDTINYEVKEGSTIVILKAAYLNTLSVSAHNVRILYTDGKAAECRFVVEEESDDDEDDGNGSGDKTSDTALPLLSPNTGGEYLIIWSVCFAVSCVALAVGFRFYKKRRSHK